MTDKFYFELTKQLRKYQDETTWLNVETIQEMVELAGLKILSVSAFPDESNLTITYTGKDAEAAFLTHIRPAVDRIRRDNLERVGTCCDDLKNSLGSRNYYPMLVFISTSAWQHPAHADRYPGATGPGYYQVYDVNDPAVDKGERVTYVPLTHCIFCHTNLEGEL